MDNKFEITNDDLINVHEFYRNIDMVNGYEIIYFSGFNGDANPESILNLKDLLQIHSMNSISIKRYGHAELEEYVDTISKSLKISNPNKVIIIGHSSGCKLASMFAIAQSISQTNVILSAPITSLTRDIIPRARNLIKHREDNSFGGTLENIPKANRKAFSQVKCEHGDLLHGIVITGLKDGVAPIESIKDVPVKLHDSGHNISRSTSFTNTIAAIIKELA